jgi:hypothetical protein
MCRVFLAMPIYYQMQQRTHARATNLHEYVIYIVDFVFSYPAVIRQGFFECLEGPHVSARIGVLVCAQLLSLDLQVTLHVPALCFTESPAITAYVMVTSAPRGCGVRLGAASAAAWDHR